MRLQNGRKFSAFGSLGDKLSVSPLWRKHERIVDLWGGIGGVDRFCAVPELASKEP